jgi:AraC-like DNA-binding protein
MSVILQPEHGPPSTRLEYWDHVLRESICPLEFRVADGLSVPDRLRFRAFGPIQVAEVLASGPSQADRTLKHVRASDPDLCKIDVFLTGETFVEQDGRQARLCGGDFTLVDCARPARWATSATHGLAMFFPRALLPLSADELANLSAVRIPGNHGVGALVSTLLRELVDKVDDSFATGNPRLVAAVLDLLSVALATRLDRAEAVPAASQQHALLVQVCAYIEDALPDPTLSPSSIAAAHHISLRYLYKLFELRHSSVADWIRTRRLEHCRHDLLDSTLRTLSVSAIGARWGLPNPAHFSRAFRAAYGSLQSNSAN